MSNSYTKFLESVDFTIPIPGKDLLYKYVSYESAEKILLNNSLLYSKADAFNDPFELPMEALNFDVTKNELMTLLRKDQRLSKHERLSIINRP